VDIARFAKQNGPNNVVKLHKPNSNNYMTDQLNLFSSPQPKSGEEYKDPKTGKTISPKRAVIMAGGALAAGAALNEILDTPDTPDITVDSDSLTEQASAEGSAQQSFNPNTAPMADSGTVSDDMPFAEAFSAAREELGAGGVFAWQGQYYNTFYAEELNDDNQPVVEYEVAEHHDLEPLEEYSSGPEPDQEETFAQEPQEPQQTGETQETQEFQETQPTQPTQETDPESSPDLMAADFDMDGNVDAVYVDINEDGSADAVYTDLNQDGQIAEDEATLIHDPENLERPETPSDGSMMSADTNADGNDDILLADVEGDQVADVVGIDQNSDMQIEESEMIILNPDAMENSEVSPAEVEYSGEIATDMPEDVSEEVLDEMNDDVASLEDNFDEIDNWS
jgi:hypothetical protein